MPAMTDFERAQIRAKATEEHQAEVHVAAIAAAAAFRTIGWTWKDTAPRTPTVDEVESRLWELIASATRDPHGWSSSGAPASGRLYIVRRTNGDLHLSLDLATLDGFLAQPAASVGAA